MKPKLVADQPYTLFSHWILPIAETYFDLVLDSDFSNFSKYDCYYTNTWNDKAQRLSEQGVKIVIDNLTEYYSSRWRLLPCHVLQNHAWFWYGESLSYRHWNYHTYCSKPQWTHLALMPMRLQKQCRDFALQILADDLDKFIWSYLSQGKSLPADIAPTDLMFQRHFLPQWYDSTAISLVMETMASSSMQPAVPLVSEKSFKPIAFSHAFIICGHYGTLKYLRSLGFETFDNLFDESYDGIVNWQQRITMAVNQCLQFDWARSMHDAETQKKIAHNRELFFDQSLVIQKIKTEILEPLKQYAET